MAFWNKNKLPAEFKEMSEDQISELLTAGKTASETAAAEKARADAAAAALTAKETELAGTKGKLTEVQTWAEKVKKEGLQAEGGNNGGGGTVGTGIVDVADWITDPNKAYEQMSAGTNAVALHAAIMSATLMADQYITQQGPVNARLWKKYKNEVVALVNALPPDQRANPQTWINNFIYIKGLHTDDIVKEGQTAGEAFFSETAGSTGRGLETSGGNQDKDTLTAQELHVAKQMGRTPEQYLASKKKMQFGPAL